MSTGRYRGLFWSPEGEQVPGTLELSDSGELRVELQGRLIGESRSLDEFDEVARIEGEIAASPFPGSMVTLVHCLWTKRQSGRGGSWEEWLAQLALIGNDIVEPDAVFDRVIISLRGLGAFIGKKPPLGDFQGKVIQIPESPTKVEQITVGEWKVVFGWLSSMEPGAVTLRLNQSPFIEITLEKPLPVDEILGKVVPVFEAILTIALRAYARVEQITVGSSREKDAYRVLGSRVDVPIESGREPREFEFLFRLEDKLGGHMLIERVRRLFSQHPGFTDTFLGYERAPPRYVEDYLRATVLALAHLTGAFPDISERWRWRLTTLKDVPAQVRAFLPSAGLVAVPELARELLTPGIGEALGVSSKEAFIESIGPAFRWAMLREGTDASGRDLLRLNHQLRALLHLALLRLLGFEHEEAEQRMVHSIQQRGLLS